MCFLLPVNLAHGPRQGAKEDKTTGLPTSDHPPVSGPSYHPLPGLGMRFSRPCWLRGKFASTWTHWHLQGASKAGTAENGSASLQAPLPAKTAAQQQGSGPGPGWGWPLQEREACKYAGVCVCAGVSRGVHAFCVHGICVYACICVNDGVVEIYSGGENEE